MRIVAIPGSLRAASSNKLALEAMKALAPRDVHIEIYEGLGSLPHFNADLDIEGANPPAAVADLRERLRASDGLLISSPEYAHGVPGSLKNALDWLVSDGLLVGKRVVLVNATPPSSYAQSSLLETLTVMNWTVVATIEVPLRGRKLDVAGVVADRELSEKLRSGIVALRT
jgi:chromate reductase, NAD(P)H dehydrogenase (quinone)